MSDKVPNTPLYDIIGNVFESLTLSASIPTKWSNILKQLVSNSWQIVWVCLTLKGLRMPPLLFNKFINYLSFLISKTQLIIHISIRCATVNTIYYTVHLKTIYTCNFSPFVSVGDYSKTLKTLLIRDKLNFGPSFNTFGVSFTRTLLKRKIMEPNK